MYAKLLSAAALFTSTAFAAPTPDYIPIHDFTGQPQNNIGQYQNGIDTSCGNQGYSFDVFEKCAPNPSSVPTDWDFHNMETLKADFSGIRSTIGLGELTIPSGEGHKASAYGSPPFETAHLGIRHQGFFYAPAAGDYTITLTGTDDAMYVFLGGDCAKTGENNLGNQVLGGAPVVKTMHVDAGYYVPFDVRWSNVMGGPYQLSMEIKDPSGKVILGAAEPAENMLVHKLCQPGRDRVWEASGFTGKK